VLILGLGKINLGVYGVDGLKAISANRVVQSISEGMKVEFTECTHIRLLRFMVHSASIAGEWGCVVKGTLQTQYDVGQN
jgi:hypothetical protein